MLTNGPQLVTHGLRNNLPTALSVACAPDTAPVDLLPNLTLSKHSDGELMDLPGTLALITH